MSKQEEMSTKILAGIVALVIMLPVLLVVGLLLGAWQGYWVSRILDEMHRAYNWPTFSVVQCMVATMLVRTTIGHDPRKGEIDWGQFVASLLGPMVVYWGVLIVLWWHQ